VVHPRGLAHALTDELVEGRPAHALGDQGEHDVAAVAVGEPLARSELARVPVEHDEIVLGRGELVRRDAHRVLARVLLDLLVEIVADAGPMREQMLDRHVVADEREVATEHRARGGRELEQPVLDQAHDGERREALRAARDPELRVDRIRDLVAAVREPLCLGDFYPPSAVDSHDAGELRLGGDRIDLGLESGHPQNVFSAAGALSVSRVLRLTRAGVRRPFSTNGHAADAVRHGQRAGEISQA
jgi:hypothetical protein